MQSTTGSPSGHAAPRALAAVVLRDALLAHQDAGGGWGERPGSPPATEPTALAMLALARSRDGRADPAVRRALAWLVARQRPDGSWPATDQVPTPSWMTADALLALSVLDVEPERRARAARWLGERKSSRLPWLARLMAWFRHLGDDQQNRGEADPTLVGWPWNEGTFGWVEPTAVSMLALRAAAARSPALARDAALQERLRSGERMLVDRTVPGGGWNFGNTRVLGEDLSPYPDTTAWALLALRGRDGRPVSGAAPAVMTGLERLERMLGATRSPLALALASLAFRAYGRDDASSRSALVSQVMDPGARWVGTRSRALALLAVAGSPFPFGA